jgi:hypothetical protein
VKTNVIDLRLLPVHFCCASSGVFNEMYSLKKRRIFWFLLCISFRHGFDPLMMILFYSFVEEQEGKGILDQHGLW